MGYKSLLEKYNWKYGERFKSKMNDIIHFRNNG